MGTTNRPVYRFQRGEPIMIARALLSGDGTGLTALAQLKPASVGSVPAETVPVAATLQSEFRTAADDMPSHWLFWLSAEAAADLPLGTYATDVRFSIDGVPVAITDPAWIVIGESVSG